MSCPLWPLSDTNTLTPQVLFEDAADADVKLEENSSSPQPDPYEFLSDQCIFCVSKKGLREFRPREKQRPDSLRRHLENIHLNRFPKGPVPCPREICNGLEFENEHAWFSHATRVHIPVVWVC
jgi:hypothetical protein